MRKKLERRIRRQRHLESMGDGKGRISIVNSWGDPIGKPICIRSLRRANRQFGHEWNGKMDVTMRDVYRRNSAKRAARAVRLLLKHIHTGKRYA